ncbi:MAG: FecR family protein [Bacteroidales bacterium]|nr:FecR family protein [Bacteroidales bacterium]
MNQKEINRLLSDYFAGTASPEQKESILSWLRESKENEIYYQECSEVWALSHMSAFTDAKESAHLDVLSKIIYQQETQKRKLWIRTAWGAAAAITILFVSLYSILFLNRQENIQPGIYTELIVPNGSRLKLYLPDSSVVWLNAGSNMKYDNDFGTDNRIVVLDGEAFFEIKSDSLKPFVIKTKEMDAVVTGTTLAVKAYENDPKTEITLLEGKVRVNHHQPDIESIVLQPNEQLSYLSHTNKVTLNKVDAVKYTGWINDKIFFADESFDLIARQLERAYDITIINKSEKLKSEKFYGSFNKSSGIQHILEVIDINNRFRWSFKNDTLTIINK